MAIYKLGVIHPRVEFVGVEILTTSWFLCHNFGSRYVRKPIKGSEDSDDSLVSKKNLSEKIGPLYWRPAPRKQAKKQKKTFVTYLPENPKPKTKKFFSISTRSLTESVDGLNSFLAQSAGEL